MEAFVARSTESITCRSPAGQSTATVAEVQIVWDRVTAMDLPDPRLQPVRPRPTPKVLRLGHTAAPSKHSLTRRHRSPLFDGITSLSAK